MPNSYQKFLDDLSEIHRSDNFKLQEEQKAMRQRQPRRLKPGPKTKAALRHQKAAMYFCVVATDEGWALDRIIELCEKLYGIRITPNHLKYWVSLYEREARMVSPGEFRTEPDLVRT